MTTKDELKAIQELKEIYTQWCKKEGRYELGGILTSKTIKEMLFESWDDVYRTGYDNGSGDNYNSMD